MVRNVRAPLLVASLALSAAACSGDPGGAAPLKTDWREVAADARVTYADIVLASYEDSLEAASELDAELAAFVADPSEDGLDAARQAWLDARESYLQTEVYRFYDGPIDNPVDGPERLLNAWPLDENYVDYTLDDPTAGIVNDPDQEISTQELARLNESGGERNISTGYHALEFLLWGQDLSDTGPGERPFTDYATDGSGTAENQDRRGQYLTTVSSLLLENLDSLVDAWSRTSATENYREEFLDLDTEESFTRILTGMNRLAEASRAELQAALESGEQENEQSRFSDNTHRDVIQDVQGIVNVWDGLYVRLDERRVQGLGVENVLLAEDPSLATEIDEQLDECLELANALERPFDQAIAVGSPGREGVEALLDALNDLDELLREAFAAFELEVFEPP